MVFIVNAFCRDVGMVSLSRKMKGHPAFATLFSQYSMVPSDDIDSFGESS